MPAARSTLAAEWASLSARLDDRPVSVTMFGDPTNARGDTVFYTMREAFAYLSGTQALNKEPIPHAVGDKFRLHYLVTVNPEQQTREQLAKRYEAWLKNSD